MEWMTLALIRAFDITGEKRYIEQAVYIWNDIKTAWNDSCGGGMAWKRISWIIKIRRQTHRLPLSLSGFIRDSTGKRIGNGERKFSNGTWITSWIRIPASYGTV